MALQSSTPKTRYWEKTSLPVISGLVPGNYSLPTITIDEYGRITNASAGAMGAGTIGVESLGAPVVGSPFATLNFISPSVSLTDAGGGVVDITVNTAINALDEGVAVGVGGFTAINFVGPTVTATDAGGGQLTVTSTAQLVSNTKRYVKATAGVAASQTIGAPIDPTGVISRVVVTITSAYSVGATLQIEDGAGTVLMPQALIGSQTVGTFVYNLPVSVIPTINTQMILTVGGAPVTGACAVIVEYDLP